MAVRFATPADRDRVIVLLRESHAAAGFTFPFEAPYADFLFQTHMSHSSTCVLVLDRPEGVAGVLMAATFDHPFGAGRMAKETVWFIAPSARGRDGLRMLDAYEAWAKEQGCRSVGMASLTTNDVSRIYERRGYVPVETHFLKPL